MKRVYTIGLALLCAAGLAACGSNNTGPSFAGTISNADAADAGGSASSFADGLASTFNFGHGPEIGPAAPMSPNAVALLNHAWAAVGGRAPRFRTKAPGPVSPLLSSAMSSCVNNGMEVISGDTTDADHDGIPANASATISCDTTLSNGTVFSEHATMHLQDIDALYGYQFSVNLSISQSHADTSISFTESGTDNATFTAASANDNLNITLSEVEHLGAVATGGAFHEDWNATYTPTLAAIVYGAALPDGHISFTGGFYATNAADPTKNFNFHILTTVPLHFIAACYAAHNAPAFDDGEIQGEFNGNATVGFTATFTACNANPTVVGTGNAS